MIHNERIKLLATALNNFGLAFAIGGFVALAINGGLRSGSGIVVADWLFVGICLHAVAQAVIGRLKP